ncbi:hypothetical protein J6590_011189 [Homalodisca vitripennis]|nr:hypothetical protein J6590_011189 [Homalodisca vitripennis]
MLRTLSASLRVVETAVEYSLPKTVPSIRRRSRLILSSRPGERITGDLLAYPCQSLSITGSQLATTRAVT